MYDLVHQYAPASPVGRTLVAVVAAFVGVPALVLAPIGLTSGNGLTGFLFLLLSAVTLTVAIQLTRGVVRQAAAAPEAAPKSADTDTGTATETPVTTLRRRYAEGALTDEEFERRLDALLETEDVEGEPAREREFAVER